MPLHLHLLRLLLLLFFLLLLLWLLLFELLWINLYENLPEYFWKLLIIIFHPSLQTFCWLLFTVAGFVWRPVLSDREVLSCITTIVFGFKQHVCFYKFYFLSLLCFFLIFVCAAFAWFSVSVSFVVGIASIYLCIYFAVIKFYALVAFALWQREREGGVGIQRLNRIRNCSVAWKYAMLLRVAILKHKNTIAARIIAYCFCSLNLSKDSYFILF